MAMRIAHVVRQFYPCQGGIETFVLSLAKHQRVLGARPEVLTLDRRFSRQGVPLPAEDNIDGLPVHRIPYFGSRRYPIAPRVLSWLEPFDIVHVHAVDFFCDYLAAAKPLHRKCLVISTHGGYFHTSFASWLKPVFFQTVTRWSLRGYSRVFASSINDEELFEKVAGDRVIRIDNGVDTDKFAGLASPTMSPTFVYFGRFAPNKGLEDLVDTFDALWVKQPNAHLHLMGSDWNGTLPGLCERISELRCRAHVKTHVDPTDSDIARIISESSFFISASRYEGFGIALVEAISAGLLPIVSKLPSFRSILGGTRAGLTVSFDHAAEAADRIAAFVARAEQCYTESQREMMERAAAYSWDTVAPRFLAEYDRALSRS